MRCAAGGRRSPAKGDEWPKRGACETGHAGDGRAPVQQALGSPGGVPSGSGRSTPPWFLVRVAMAVTGVAVLLVLHPGGALDLFAWWLIGAAVLREALASIVFLRRRPRDGAPRP